MLLGGLSASKHLINSMLQKISRVPSTDWKLNHFSQGIEEIDDTLPIMLADWLEICFQLLKVFIQHLFNYPVLSVVILTVSIFWLAQEVLLLREYDHRKKLSDKNVLQIICLKLVGTLIYTAVIIFAIRSHYDTMTSINVALMLIKANEIISQLHELSQKTLETAKSMAKVEWIRECSNLQTYGNLSGEEENINMMFQSG
jgi:hypothetical protein